jgi:transcription-repair coupling factor (superfamily II helicase)
VAVLAPTTILVEQHMHTFQERLADYPVRVEALSGSAPPASRRRSWLSCWSGEVDVVVGTHRLLQPDVAFATSGCW